MKTMKNIKKLSEIQTFNYSFYQFYFFKINNIQLNYYINYIKIKYQEIFKSQLMSS